MTSPKKICVFLSGRVLSPADCQEAYDFGALLAKNGFDLVFGGADSPSLMRELARGVHENGGQSTSIIPTCFGWDLTGELGTIFAVADMAERKRKMLEMSDAFVALKGGLGTLDEVIEVWTIKTMGAHNKPILLTGSSTYQTAFKQLFQVMVDEGTVDQHDWDAIEWHDSSASISDKLKIMFS